MLWARGQLRCSLQFGLRQAGTKGDLLGMKGRLKHVKGGDTQGYGGGCHAMYGTCGEEPLVARHLLHIVQLLEGAASVLRHQQSMQAVLGFRGTCAMSVAVS